MPYAGIEDLPPSVRSRLPEHAQEIYRAAFNNAYEAHAGDAHQEEIARRIAWSAVKHRYVKINTKWIARS